MYWDIFISHASEDKAPVADPLATALRTSGYRVWYDSFELRLGDSLRQSIEKGIANSKFGVVVLSPSFFGRKWTESELNGLSELEVDGRKMILPVWYNVTATDIRKHSPMLADRRAVNWAIGAEAVIKQILDVVGKPEVLEYPHEIPLTVPGDIPQWRDPRFVRVGLTCGYLEPTTEKPKFSQRFVRAFAEQSHLAISVLDSSFEPPEPDPDQAENDFQHVWSSELTGSQAVGKIWPNLNFTSILKAKKKEAPIGIEDLEYFIEQMAIPFTHLLSDYCVEAQLVQISESGEIRINQDLLEELFALSIYIDNVGEAQRSIVTSLVRLVEARLAIRKPNLMPSRFLLALFLYLVMEIGPFIEAIETAIEFESKSDEDAFDTLVDKRVSESKGRRKAKSENQSANKALQPHGFAGS